MTRIQAPDVKIMNTGPGSDFTINLGPLLHGVPQTAPLTAPVWSYVDSSLVLVKPSNDGFSAHVSAKSPVGITDVYAMYTNSDGDQFRIETEVTIVEAAPDVDGFAPSITGLSLPAQE